MKFYSFCKVGGGFRAEDYANIMHQTDGKWVEWDRKHPPTEYIELGGPDGQTERPDVWIKPSDSVVVEVKAASVGGSESFKTSFTLRFPRFKLLRMDKDWQSALSIHEFLEVKKSAEAERAKDMKVDNSRRKISKRLKKELTIAGNDSKIKTPYAGPKTAIFEGLSFCVLSEMLHPQKKNKAEVEQLLKGNGASIVQSPTAKEDVICLADKKVVKVASLIKSGHTNVVKSAWVLHVLRQAELDGPGRERYLVPFEPGHMFHMTPDAQESIEGNVDSYGDSYARDMSVDELRKLFDDMIHPKNSTFSPGAFLSELENRGKGLGETRGSVFRGCVAWFAGGDGEEDVEYEIAKTRFRFGGGVVAESEDDENVTHVIVRSESPARVRSLRAAIARLERRKLPRMVRWDWVRESWDESTLLAEERYAVVA
jgi:DNA ligase-4